MRDMQTALQMLMDRAADHLTDEDLSLLADGVDVAQMHAQHLSEVVCWIGCLVASDETCGSFQHKAELPGLLFHVGAHADMIANLFQVAGRAESIRLFRREAGA